MRLLIILKDLTLKTQFERGVIQPPGQRQILGQGGAGGGLQPIGIEQIAHIELQRHPRRQFMADEQIELAVLGRLGARILRHPRPVADIQPLQIDEGAPPLRLERSIEAVMRAIAGIGSSGLIDVGLIGLPAAPQPAARQGPTPFDLEALTDLTPDILWLGIESAILQPDLIDRLMAKDIQSQ